MSSFNDGTVDEMAKVMPMFIREVHVRHNALALGSRITISNMVILEFLKERGPCSMSEISGAMNLSMSAATAVVDKMISSGLVRRQRSDEDRRVVRVQLLKKGGDVAAKVQQLRRKVINDMCKTLTDEEKHEYLRLIKKVYKGLKREI